MQRISWEQYALRLAQTAAMRSQDPFVQVGAVVMRHDHSIAGIGYNGAPAGVDIDWSNRDARRPFVVHAEANALRYTRPNECYLMVTTLSPCSSCLTIAATYGIKVIRYQHKFVDSGVTDQIAAAFGIDLQQIDYEPWEQQVILQSAQ